MLAKLTLAAAALATAATVTPAHAVVDGCTAAATSATRGTCIFVSTGGQYYIGISHTGRYGWTQVDCVPQGGDFVDAWNTSPEFGRDQEPTYLPPGTCTVEVAVDGGAGYGWVSRVPL